MKTALNNIYRVLVQEYKGVQQEYEEEKKQVMPNDIDIQNRTKSQTVSRVTRNAGQSASDIANSGGKFVRVEGDNFDIIINILIGIRRSVSSLYISLPG